MHRGEMKEVGEGNENKKGLAQGQPVIERRNLDEVIKLWSN